MSNRTTRSALSFSHFVMNIRSSRVWYRRRGCSQLVFNSFFSLSLSPPFLFISPVSFHLITVCCKSGRKEREEGTAVQSAEKKRKRRDAGSNLLQKKRQRSGSPFDAAVRGLNAAVTYEAKTPIPFFHSLFPGTKLHDGPSFLPFLLSSSFPPLPSCCLSSPTLAAPNVIIAVTATESTRPHRLCTAF